MNEPLLRLVVIGEPVPQGSKVKTRWGMREDNPNTRPWRATVASYAAAEMNGRELLDGPLALDVRFYFPRPNSHFGTGRNAGVLKPNAPVFHSKAPDCDKLVRAIGDALTGVAIRDDARIAVVVARKFYGEPARAEITVGEATSTGELLLGGPVDVSDALTLGARVTSDGAAGGGGGA